VLKQIFGAQFYLFGLSKDPIGDISSVANAFRGHLDGLNNETIATILNKIGSQDIRLVFVDGSNYGEIVKAIKERFPQVHVCTFFHNAEARFFFGALLEHRNIRSLGILMANYLAERKAVRYSDKIICLSERDSDQLRKLYGRTATHISPMALADKFDVGIASLGTAKNGPFALFVGGGFYANRAGIVWFVKNVVPRISIKTCIVGRGLEDLRDELECAGKVELIGAVERLAPWYAGAQFVIAPIFDGSGMKTKVAEALMFGKKVIGTPEAFSGYENVVGRAGWVCSTADEFVAAIGQAQDEIVHSFDTGLRALYEEKYSLPAAQTRLAEILRTAESF